MTAPVHPLAPIIGKWVAKSNRTRDHHYDVPALVEQIEAAGWHGPHPQPGFYELVRDLVGFDPENPPELEDDDA